MQTFENLPTNPDAMLNRLKRSGCNVPRAYLPLISALISAAKTRDSLLDIC